MEKIPIGTQIKKRKQTISKIRAKFGDCFLHDLKRVGDGYKYSTFALLGNKYGLSRERVRQIFKVIYGCGRREVKTIKDIDTCIHDPRRKVADYNSNSWNKKAAEIELEFYNICNKRGFIVTTCNSGKIDQTVNGFKVDIKGSYSNPRTMGLGSKTKYHSYSCSLYQYDNCDFFACWHPTVNSFFIIPKENIPLRSSINRYSKYKKHLWYISSEKSYYKNSKNRCWEFKDAWNLLETQIQKDVMA